LPFGSVGGVLGSETRTHVAAAFRLPEQEMVNSTTGSTSPETARLSGAALIAAFAVLVAFAAFVVFLIGETDAADVRWTRLAWLFTSVEAIAFGAAGALFGSSIQRARAEKAEQAAQENAGDAAKGRALAEALKADAPDPHDQGGLEALGPDQGREAIAIAYRHAELARRLFP
jgi:hypothetical protein